MPRFAANLTTMFTEYPEAERFHWARTVGFEAVEYLFPYKHSIATVKQWLDDAELKLILINTPMGNPKVGERGLACLPGREAEFRDCFEAALEYATQLGADMIHLMAGVVPADQSPEQCEEVFIENVRSVTTDAQRHGVRILLEPLNTQDTPDYLHSRSDHTRRIIERVDASNVQMQFDFYHLQIMEGNLAAGLRRHLDVIGHLQFSSVPGRHEPAHGEVNLPFLFNVADELGYEGWIGCEYTAKTDTLAGLDWARTYGIDPTR